MTRELPEPEAIRQKARAFVLRWIAHRQGSAAELDFISIDLISRAAGRIEEMGRRLQPPREATLKKPRSGQEARGRGGA